MTLPIERSRLASRCFRAMGTEVELFLAAPATAAVVDAFDEAEHEFARLERIFSRFDPCSELSLLNRLGRIAASRELLDLTDFAVAARLRTAGLVDVTVHDALAAWGYDRTYTEVAGRVVDAPSDPPRCGGAIGVDRAARTIELEPGIRLDFGGLAKGLAADRAADILRRRGPCLVNAGGDLAVHAGENGPWPVGVDTLGDSLTLSLSAGGLATSGRDARAWQAGDVSAHHLIDPRTSSPSTSALLRVTAWGPSALEAEVRAKLLFLLGPAEGEAWATAEGVPAVLVPESGDAIRTWWVA